MKKEILRELEKLEQQENIHILYAVESGSRAWGFPSRDSDYDVRFIYTRPKNWYLQLQKTKDTLEYPISQQLDISGWDLDKTLRLLQKSNPALLEWLHSTILYRKNEAFHAAMLQLSRHSIQEQKLIFHYLHMAKGNFRDYLQGEEVKIKKYFYVLRPLLACMWIESNQTVPPVLFQDLLKMENLTSDFLKEVEKLLARKIVGEELALEPSIPVIQQFIIEKIAYYEAFTAQLEKGSALSNHQLNSFFLEWYGTEAPR